MVLGEYDKFIYLVGFRIHYPELSAVRILKTRPWYEGKDILKRMGSLPMDMPFGKSYHDGPRMWIAHEGYNKCYGINKNGDKALFKPGGYHECAILVNNEWTLVHESFGHSHYNSSRSFDFDITGNRFVSFDNAYSSSADVYEWTGVKWVNIAHVESNAQYAPREVPAKIHNTCLSGDGKYLYYYVYNGKLVYDTLDDAKSNNGRSYFRCLKISDKPSPIYYDAYGNESLRGNILNHEFTFRKHVEKNFSFKN